MAEIGYEDLDRYIDEISSGRKLAFVQINTGKEVPLFFKHPSHHNKQIASYIYHQALKEAEAMELPAEKEMEEIIKRRGLFSRADEEQLQDLEKKIDNQKIVLAKTTRVPANRARVQKIISDLEDRAVRLKLKREELLGFTRERKAQEEKLLYLTWSGTSDVFSESLYWSTYEDFQIERDFAFRRDVYIKYVIFHYGISPKIVREIARSNLWRIRYIHSLKTGESLFGVPQSEYTIDQIMLCHWSNFYQSVYEMLPDERPPESVIEDDAALDAYMKDYMAERNRQDTSLRAKKSKYGKPTAWDYQETLVMKSNEMYEDVEYSKTLKQQGLDKGSAVSDAAYIGRGKKR